MKAPPGDIAPPPEGDLQDAPIESVPYVGPTVATVLRARGVGTVGDLLAQLPRRYLDLRGADDWRRVRHAETGTLVSVEGLVEDARWAGNPRARRLSIALREPRGTSVLRAVFFHAKAGMSARLAPGMTVRLTGSLKQQPNGPELVQPKVLAPGTRTRSIEPIYAGIGSVPPGTVLRIVTAALERAAQWGDPVPTDVARALGLPRAPDALRLLHAPDASVTPAGLVELAQGRSPAHRRLAFEELLAVSVALERARRSAGGARVFTDPAGVAELAGARLGLSLTGGQREVIATLLGDLGSGRPMRRLLVGDVGSGKTAVALAASLAVLRGGGSVAWLCPTTLVAAQHAKTLERGLAGDAGPMAVLLGSTTARARRQAEKVIAEGLVRMVVGTHAILEAGGTPPALDLVVIDEQHRFGVAQRLAMVAGRSPSPHLLVLSATPIPRTLALAQYGDLDLVTLAERPANRQPVTTRVVAAGDREFVQRTIQRALDAGGRVFVVVPRIDGAPDEDDGPKTGVADAEAWLAEALGRDRVVLLHGRMSADAQKEALDAFRRGTHPLLIGTTVVEVGLDVPEANLMVILGAEFFGVAQLHQLRGRVGRGGQRAACLLVPEGEAEGAAARLEEVAGCADGFVLAERDLARRGAGEWFGERQSGADLTLRFADPVRDVALLAAAREAAARIVADDPSLARHPTLSRAVRRLLQRGASPVAEEAG
ncbi:MAG: helicase-related protein [Deltaproteobacteria bacterium]|nr:helicase-related protein [Myxococcales bacterium]MDP3218594.1 helicase-related protein [Deltaproteobacteria bacterium]